MLMYIMKYQTSAMQQMDVPYYPKNLFDLTYIDNFSFFFGGGGGGGSSIHDFVSNSSVARNAIILYFVWFVPYTLWMLCLGGMELPSKYQYDTVLHSMWRGGTLCEVVGTKVWKDRTKEQSRHQKESNAFERRDFIFYMILHALGSCGFGILGLAWVCHSLGGAGHLLCIVLSVFICCHRGAQRYTFYTTSMYGRRIRKYITKQQQQNEEKKRK